jgi:hypothetical protein
VIETGAALEVTGATSRPAWSSAGIAAGLASGGDLSFADRRQTYGELARYGAAKRFSKGPFRDVSRHRRISTAEHPCPRQWLEISEPLNREIAALASDAQRNAQIVNCR